MHVKRALRIITIALTVGVLYFSFNLWQVWSVGRIDESRSVDAIVVLGAAQYDGRPSPQLGARLDHAITLWQEGRAQFIIVTGGKQQADRFTEAEAAAKYLETSGVPVSAIALENAGHTTRESLLGVREILAARGLHSLLIVTDPYHALRARLIAQDLDMQAFVSPTRSGTVQGSENLMRHLREAGGVAISHVIGFAQLERFTR
ncbi:MAG: YdcF family protein [Ilumatobacteraceae bacterium]